MVKGCHNEKEVCMILHQLASVNHCNNKGDCLQKRGLLLLDLSNLYCGYNAMGYKAIDHILMIQSMIKGLWVSSNHVIAYGGKHKDNVKFLKVLRDNGVKTVTKPAREGRKCNFDVEIAVDAMIMSSDVDVIMIASGDSDFAYVGKKLKQLGKEVIFYAFSNNCSSKLSNVRYLDEKIKEQAILWNKPMEGL